MPSSNLATLRQAAEQIPDSIDLWLDLVEAAEKEKNYAEVLRAGDEIVRLAPGKAQPHFIRGMALHRLDRIDEAIEAYKRVLEFNPNYADAWVNLGECHQFFNRISEAEHAYRRAIEAVGQSIADEDTCLIDESEYGNQHWNLALLELLKGDYPRGFKRYSARFKAIANRKRQHFPQPLWRGEDVRGKTILITVDQGLGDTLMMMRYLPLLRARGAKVLLQAQAPLVSLIKDWNGVDQVLEQGCAEFPPFDYHASEFDLPRYFGTTLETVPANVPYLPLLPADDATRLKSIIPPHPNPLPPVGGEGIKKVGVTWAGNPDHRNDRRRTIPLAVFSALFGVEGAQFYSLTRDKRPWDEQFLAQLPVIDLAPCISDLAATARIVNQLDLIITCDTSIAHLAGGMGKPVWVLLPFAPDWRWMLEREDSPWYPTARLFRQKNRGDWGEVIKDVRMALDAW